MIDAKRLLKELKERKEKQKSVQAKFDEFAKVANTAAAGVDRSFRASVTAATIAHTPIPTNVSIAGLVFQLIAALPAIIETLNSDKPASEKLAALAPLLVFSSLTTVAVILTLVTLALAGAIAGLSLACLFVGFTGYNLFKAYLAREAIGTTFENKVDNIKGIYDYLMSSDADKAISVDQAARAELMATVQARLADLKAGQSSDKILDELEIALNDLAAHDQKVSDMQPEAVELRRTIANEDQILSSGVSVGFAIGGVVLAIIGVLALTIGAAPVVGTIVAVFSLILMTVSLVQLATDLALKRAENQKAEAAGDDKIVELINDAQFKSAPEIQAAIPDPAPVSDLPSISPEIVTQELEKEIPKNNWRKDPAPSSGPGHNGETLFGQKNPTTTVGEVLELNQDSKRRTL